MHVAWFERFTRSVRQSNRHILYLNCLWESLQAYLSELGVILPLLNKHLALLNYEVCLWKEKNNEAGYTANTSCGRVGRGGNARFHTFQLDHHGPTDRRTDGPTDKASYRVACPRLKREILLLFSVISLLLHSSPVWGLLPYSLKPAVVVLRSKLMLCRLIETDS